MAFYGYDFLGLLHSISRYEDFAFLIKPILLLKRKCPLVHLARCRFVYNKPLPPTPESPESPSELGVFGLKKVLNQGNFKLFSSVKPTKFFKNHKKGQKFYKSSIYLSISLKRGVVKRRF